MSFVRSAWLVPCLLAAFAAGSANAQSITSTEGKPAKLISGVWKITGVIVGPGKVQALRPDDPAYMGAVLEISEAWMAWRPHKTPGTFGDVCMAPRIVADAIKCEYGSFGPPGAKILYADGRLAIDWYDNARLVFARTN